MTDQEDQNTPAVHKPRMAVPPQAPPGIEQDDKGNLIPFEKRTPEDQERARSGN